MPQITVVFPILNTAEPSARVIEDTLTLIGRKDRNCLPSGLISWAYTQQMKIAQIKLNIISLC